MTPDQSFEVDQPATVLVNDPGYAITTDHTSFRVGMFEGKTPSECEAMVGTSPSLSKGGCQEWETAE